MTAAENSGHRRRPLWQLVWPADVHILYRRRRQDMPAGLSRKLKAAEHEGIKIEYLVGPHKEIVSVKERSPGSACERMKLGDFDKSGRKRPISIQGSVFTVNVDTVIAAIGQVPDLSFVPKKSSIQVNNGIVLIWRKVAGPATDAQFYAGGDAVTGPDTVIGAIAAGHQAAKTSTRRSG